MKDNHKPFIDGSWYDKEYSTPGSRYSQIYDKPIPEWARQSNLFHARFIETLFEMRNKCLPPVLDLGAGVGRQLDTWEYLGYHGQGVEISEEAVKRSGRKNIVRRSAADLSCFPDGSFHVAHSNAFFEHISPEITADVVRESMRVARYGAHWIPMEKGDDPSHIHIQSREEWIAELLTALGKGFAVGCVENPVDETQPLFVVCRLDDLPWPITMIDTFRVG